MEVRDGGRHIYANLEPSITSPDSNLKTSQNCHITACGGPRVLVNTQMKNSACMQKTRCITKEENRDTQRKCERRSKVSGSHKQTSSVMEDTESLYKEPEIHSTLHVAMSLGQARKMQPNVSQLMMDKLDSPNTSAKLKKQPTKKVNIPKSQAVFQELVSVDVSEDALESHLRSILNIRSEGVRHSPGHPDPVPTPSDILEPEDYVSRTAITKTNFTSVPTNSVQPQKLTRKDLCDFSTLVMNLP